jgi:hypothetical protein
MSLKNSDLHTVPLCDEHHKYFHRWGAIEPFDRAATNQLFADAMVACLALALESGLKL